MSSIGIAAPSSPSAATDRSWHQRVPPLVMVALAVAALFATLVFAGSEMVLAQTATLQHRLAQLSTARVNGLQMQLAVQEAEHAASEAGLSRSEATRRLQEAGDKLWLQQGLIEGMLSAEPAVKDRSRRIAALLQAHLDTLRQHIDAPVPLVGGPSSRMLAAELASLDAALQQAQNRAHADIADVHARQRKGAAVLVGMDLLFLAGLVARAIQRHYEQEQQRMDLASQAHKLEEAVAQRTNELHDLSTYLQQQSEREKSRLARELHDELGALLTAAKLDVAWLEGRAAGGDESGQERLSKLSHALDQALNIKRHVLESLRPSLLDHLGLGPALVWYVQQTCDSADLAHDIDLPPDGIDVDKDTALALYRIVQEALNNTIQHAHATEARVSLKTTGERLTLRISDDGIGIAGFEPERLSHGMAGMRHRARAIGGRFDVRSVQGEGTTIVVDVPRHRGSGPQSHPVRPARPVGLMPPAPPPQAKPCVSA